MSSLSMKVEAVFEGGVFQPILPVQLPAKQRVTLIVQLPESAKDWPEDTATIYQELEAEDEGGACNVNSCNQANDR